MTDPSTIQAALLLGQQYYASNLAEYLVNLKAGCTGCAKCGKYSCLEKILSALQYQVESNLYNGTTETLYLLLIMQVGNYTPEIGVQWGFSSTDPSTNLANLDYQFNKAFGSGTQSISLPFSPSADQNYLFVETPLLQPTFYKWFNVAEFNQGDIPDSVWAFETIGQKKIYYTRNPFNLDPTTDIITLSTN